MQVIQIRSEIPLEFTTVRGKSRFGGSLTLQTMDWRRMLRCILRAYHSRGKGSLLELKQRWSVTRNMLRCGIRLPRYCPCFAFTSLIHLAMLSRLGENSFRALR